MKNQYIVLLLSYGLLIVSLFSEPSARQFQNGDRVCFIGDSITHGGNLS